MSFRRYFVVRLAWTLVGLWMAATAVFVLFFVVAPDPRGRCNDVPATRACIEFVEENYHLGSPLYEQYGFFLWRLVADQSTGRSFNTLEEVGTDAREAIPASLSVVVPALLLAAGVGVVGGAGLARARRRRIYDVPIYVALGLSPIVVGLVLSYYIGFRWNLTPISGYCDFFNPPPPPPPPYAFGPRVDECKSAADWASHLILPVIALSVYFTAIYTRVVRALVVQARSLKDPDERRKRRRRSSLLVVRSVGRDFGFVLGLSALVEVVFDIPGMGRSAVVAAAVDDLVLLQALVLYATFLAIAVHFVVDVVVGALDPDLRWEKPVARRPKPA